MKLKSPFFYIIAFNSEYNYIFFINIMVLIEFDYNGEKIIIQIEKETKIGEIFNKFGKKLGINTNFLFFLYSGNNY